MQIQVNTDHHIHGREAFIAKVEAEVNDALGRYGEQITRVEVHLNDVNGGKAGDNDKRCLMEARIAGHQPVAASHQAETLEQALDGASKKLHRLVDHTLDRMKDSKGRASIRTDFEEIPAEELS